MKLFDLLVRGAAVSGDRIAVTHGESSLSYYQLLARSEKLAHFLKNLSIPAGARAAIFCDNSLEYIIFFFAAARAGFVAVPLDTSLKSEKIEFILKDCGARILLMQAKYFRHLEPLLETDSSLEVLITEQPVNLKHTRLQIKMLGEILANSADAMEMGNNPGVVLPDQLLYANLPACPNELAAIFYTSGSTGIPKGVMLSHLNLIANTIATVEYLKLTETDSIIVILPFHYIYGNSLLLTHIMAGGRIVIDNRFAFPQVVLETMLKEQVSGFSGVPSNFMSLLPNKNFCSEKLKNLRYLTQAGGGMAPEVIRKALEAFPDKEIYIMYGQTEAAPRVSYLPPALLPDKIGSIGIPIPGVQIMVADEQGREVPEGEVGEIIVKGDNVMLGYWNQPEEQSEVLRNGWLYTGDLARRDPDGFLYIVSRKKEILKVGGKRVSAREVEECLLESDLVREVAVVGVKDSILGEAIRAVIVLNEGKTCDPEILKKHCLAKLAKHKVPQYVEFVKELPKFTTGKVNKMALTTE